MSNSNQDSGISGIIAAVLAFGLLVIIGGGVFFVYQRSLAARLALVRAEEMRALAMAQDAAAQIATAQEAAAAQIAVAKQAAHQTLLNTQDNQETDKRAEESIRAQLMSQQADWNQGDLDAFMKVYWKSEQLTFASGGKITRGWQATLDGYKSRYPSQEKLGKLTFGDLEFQGLDQSVMLVLGTWHLERGADSIGGNFSLVWKKIDDQWLIIHDHTSVLSPPK